MRYYDIHVNDGVSSFSVFMSVKNNTLVEKPSKEEVAGHAVDINMLDPDDLRYVDNVTEITEEEFNRAIQV